MRPSMIRRGDAAGYLTATGDGDPDYAFTGEIESYPEDWREERNGIERLRANRKRRMPQMVTVAPDGRYDSSGKSFWFIGDAAVRLTSSITRSR
ncbi:hypothetical protein CHELA20_53775 [Hyphomicrobiales bacterium]|nr:hypothetical protein CHELA41_21151 [Hyphomicrobiales bacterium]CAH1684924.1 hypothetical protein CHELA20_53775 [Hyphomicrobiales bacterium]